MFLYLHHKPTHLSWSNGHPCHILRNVPVLFGHGVQSVAKDTQIFIIEKWRPTVGRDVGLI